MSKISDPFVLRAVTSNHSQDVRWVSAGPKPNQILSCSRDKTARCFSYTDDATDGFYDVLQPVGSTLEGHLEFVNFVTYHPAVPFLDGEAAIVTGSNDKYLIFWSAEKGTMEAILGGHGNAVKCCAVLHPSMDVVTGSWDHTAIVWDIATGGIKQHFAHHDKGVLAIAQVGPRDDAAKEMVVTASGDRTIALWDVATCTVKQIFKAHTDSVQAVVAIGDGTQLFASGGNDGRIAIWHLNSPAPLSFLQAHESLIFSLCYLSTTNEIASAADDRTVKVWGIDKESSELVCSQVINFPTTVWSVCAADDNSGGEYKQCLVTGTADAAVRLWSRNLDLCASAEKIAELEERVSSQEVDVKSLQAAGYKVTPVTAIDALKDCNTIEGEYEGQRKLFKTDGGQVELYTWAGGTWEKIGNVVITLNELKTPYRGEIPKQQHFFAGQSWDYLFDIDFGGGRSAKLPYNGGESIFEAAQRFINMNGALGARQEHKEAIQNHILKNISPEDLEKIGVSAGGGAGGGGGEVAFSAYAKEAAEMARKGIKETPSWGQAKQAFEQTGDNVAFSTFAQEEAAAARKVLTASTSASSASQPSSPTSALPNCVGAVETFLPLDPAAVKKKTAELVGGTPQFDAVIDAAVAATSSSGSSTSNDLATVVEGLVGLFNTLNQGSRFPALDVLRYVATTKQGAAYLSSADGKSGELIYGSLLASEKAFVETALTSEAERLVGLRLFANMIANGVPSSSSSSSSSSSFAELLTKVIDVAVRPMLKRSNPPVNANQKAAATAILVNAAMVYKQLATTTNGEDGALNGCEAGDGSFLDTLTKTFFLAVSEGILFEKETPAQVKLLNIANTVIVTAASSSSSTTNASVFALVKHYATKMLQRFCQGSLRHVDKGLSTAAAAVYQHVKPADDQFE